VNDVLKKLSLLIGGVMFFISLVLGIISNNGVNGMVLFRALMVLFLSTMTVGIFFRYFAGILYNFVIQKMEENQEEADEVEEETLAAQEANRQPEV
jgi:uncharacterized membrane protein (DUF106 family)